MQRLLASVLLLASCRAPVGPEGAGFGSPSGQPGPRVAREYVVREERPLTLFVQPPVGTPPARGWPALVFFHGGAWRGGDPSQFFDQCEHLARRGVVGISAEYRLTGRDGTTPFECVVDGKAAVRWVRAHAAELQIDPQRIGAGGGSAGGQVAAAVALVDGFDLDADSPVSCRPDALVLFNPVFDNGPDGWGHGLVKQRWREFSPLHNVRAGMPPSIVLLGTADALVPVDTATRFGERARSAGARCEVRLYDDAPHGFFNKGRSEQWFAETMVHVDEFLVTLGWMEELLE